jgi:hypothetical protein
MDFNVGTLSILSFSVKLFKTKIEGVYPLIVQEK